MESKEMASAIADMLSSKKAKDIVMIDIAEKSSFADYFVIATGTSDRQLVTILFNTIRTVHQPCIQVPHNLYICGIYEAKQVQKHHSQCQKSGNG